MASAGCLTWMISGVSLPHEEWMLIEQLLRDEHDVYFYLGIHVALKLSWETLVLLFVFYVGENEILRRLTCPRLQV